jgi:ABC-type transporter Mla MlaB component
LREAADLKALLLSTVPPAGEVIIEGGAVERIDTAGLQLLAAFARREAAAGRCLAWQSASAELRGASARLGLLDCLGLEGLDQEGGGQRA